MVITWLRRLFPWLLSVVIMHLHPMVMGAQTSEELRSRRKAVLEKMAPKSVMILRSRGSFGQFHGEAQDADFYYLTGLDEPGAYLILISAPDTESHVVLFVKPKEPERADWDPQPLGADEAEDELGIEDVRPSPRFESYFAQLLLEDFDTLYMKVEQSETLTGPLTADEQILRRARELGAGFRLMSPDPILGAMGRRRSESEVARVRRAADITSEAQLAAMRAIRPGMYEYQLQAVVELVYAMNGAGRSAFPSIIGSGVNSCILHWMLNNRQMKSGDLVVVDIGAEYELYGADITRTLPVDGTFTKRQRQVYEIVLAANTAAIEMVAPGVRFEDISRKAADIVGEGLVRLGWIAHKDEYRKYYFHGLGHPIGLRVGGASRLDVLEPGMIITIEPGIYNREEALGVRIEDDVLVTENGHEVLSKTVPKTVDDVERLMKEEGMDYAPYVLSR